MAEGVLKRGNRHIARPYDPLIGNGRYLGTFDTPKEARQRIAEWRVLRDNPEKMRLSVFSEEWVASMKGRVSDRTLEEYSCTAKQICSLMPNDPPIASITARMVEDMIGASIDRYSGSTTRKQLTRLRQMLNTAVRWKWINTNIAADKFPLPRAKKRKVIPLSPEQAQALIDATDDYFKPVFLLVLTSGLRWEEVFGLRWRDIDFKKSALHVTQALWSGKLGPLKSEAANRIIELPPQTIAALKAQRHVCPANDHDLVFPNQLGRPMSSSTWGQTVMTTAAEAAKMPHVRLHDLRHVYCSLLIREGCSPKLVQYLMGHATIKTTFDTYGHLFPDEKAEAAVKVGNYFGSKTVTAGPKK